MNRFVCCLLLVVCGPIAASGVASAHRPSSGGQAVAPPGRGQDELWGEITLSGGTAAAWRVLQAGGNNRTSASFLIDLARRNYASSVEGGEKSAERFSQYVNHAAALERHLAGWPDGLSLSSATAGDRDRRNAFREVLDLLALRTTGSEAQTRVEVQSGEDQERTLAWLAAMGIDAKFVADRLNKGEPVRLTVPTDRLPLPLPAAWGAALDETAPVSVDRIVRDPKAMFLYLGLMAVDRETMAWLAGHPRSLRRLYDDQSAVWAAFGRSFRIRDGRVATPGGADASSLWEDLADVPVTRADEFLHRLLDRDAGRLAYFYDTVAHVDEIRQQFLLGHSIGQAGDRERLRFVRRVYERFASLPSWEVSKRPLFRPHFDPSLAVSVVGVLADGSIGPDWWPGLFARLSSESSWPSKPADTLKNLGRRKADAAWLLEWLFEDAERAETRFAWLRLVQRAFARADRDAAPAVEVAARTLQEMPALALSLERMGITDPYLFEAVARAARGLTLSGGDEAVPGVRAWQGALAVLEQLTRHGVLRTKEVSPLLQSLAASAPRGSGDGTIVATWVLHRLWPALNVPVTPDATEDLMLRRLLSPRQKPAPTFRWENIDYKLDWLGATAESAIEIRKVTPGPRLEHLQILAECDRQLGGGVRSIDEVAALVQMLEPVRASLAALDEGPGGETRIARDLAEALERLKRLNARNVSRATRERRVLADALGSVSSVVLPAIAYALAAAPTSQPARLFADAPATHDFGVNADRLRWQEVAWAVPVVVERPAGGTAVRGSLLGIDIARAPDRFRRVMGSSSPATSTVPDTHFEVFADRLALRAELTDWEQEGAAIVAAVAAGRAEVLRWKDTPPDEKTLTVRFADAGISEWRQNLMSWTAARIGGDAFAGMWLPADLYRLGGGRELPRGWGQSSRGFDTCWCLWTTRRSPEDWLGRQSGNVPGVSYDLAIQLSVLLADARLPQTLIEPLLPMAVQDLIDHAMPFGFNDWEAYTWPRGLTLSRIDDYFQELVQQRLLTAPGTSGESVR